MRATFCGITNIFIVIITKVKGFIDNYKNIIYEYDNYES